MTVDGRAASVSDSAKVNGSARYAADQHPDDVVDVVFVYAPVSRARIAGVDTAAAKAVEGVVAVVTGADIGEVRYGRWVQDEPILAFDEVLFAGQRVAAVAAVDRATAVAAAGLVDVDYEELPELCTVAASSADGADPLHPSYEEYAGHRPSRPHPNQQGFQEIVVGDPDAAWDAAEVIVEETFEVARSHSAPMEPHACVVRVDGDHVEVWSSHKEPFNLRRHLAVVAECPVESVTVHPAPLGGDFGSKGSAFHELACFFVAREVGRPVRSILSFSEMLLATSARHHMHLRLRTGLMEGRISVHDIDAVCDGGAFAAHKPHPLGVVFVAGHGLEPYAVPARRDRCEVFYTNSLPASHVRGPGIMQAVFASECHVDELAKRIGEDPIRFRERHATHDEMRRVLNGIATHVHTWRAEPGAGESGDSAVGRGVGISAFQHRTGPGRTTVEVEAAAGAGVEVRVTVPDQGAGAHESIRRIACRALGLVHGDVRVRQVAPDDLLVDAGAGASRVTTVVGEATVRACSALLEELGLAGGWPAEITVDEVLDRLGRNVVRTQGSATASNFGRASFGALAVDVTVERTGKIRLNRAALVADTGAIVNPIGHRGQLEGAFIFGLSQALYEELHIADGQVVSASLGDYDVAKCGDAPPLAIDIIDADRSPDIDDIGSVGELSNLGVAPAISNAVADAIGVRLRRLPMTPDVVWAAMQDRPPTS